MSNGDRKTWRLWKVWALVGVATRVDLLLLGMWWGWWL